MRAALALLALASCGRIGFNALGDDTPGNGNGDGGSSTDDGTMSGGPDANLNNTCVAPGGGCSFDQLGNLCSCWGTPTASNSSISFSNGTLTMNPNANAAGAQSMCNKAAVPFTAAGAFIEVSAVLSVTDAITALQIGTSPDVFEMAVINGQLRTTDGSNQGTSTYNPVAMRWWRIRPLGADGTAFDISADGKSWTTPAVSGRVASGTYDVKIIAGTPTASPAPGAARFEGINVCPP